MVTLRPLIVVTGTLHVEGGFSRKRVKDKALERVSISDERHDGNVVASRYNRKLRELRLLHTPYGTLVDPKNLTRIKDMIAQATIDCQAFNAAHETCKVASRMLWEHLKGNRLDAVIAWVDRRLRDGDETVTAVLGSIVAEAAAGAA